jgi:hypothetical protein
LPIKVMIEEAIASLYTAIQITGPKVHVLVQMCDEILFAPAWGELDVRENKRSLIRENDGATLENNRNRLCAFLTNQLLLPGQAKDLRCRLNASRFSQSWDIGLIADVIQEPAQLDEFLKVEYHCCPCRMLRTTDAGIASRPSDYGTSTTRLQKEQRLKPV